MTGGPAAGRGDGVRFVTDLDGIVASMLGGFFDGWPDPPSAEAHLRILRGSDAVALALRGDVVAGFATAISDGALSAYIPLAEVRAEHRGRGVGSGLVAALIEALPPLYMIDAVCDASLEGFYARLGFRRGVAMLRRDLGRQRGL